MSNRRCKNFIDTYMLYTQQSEPPSSYHRWSAMSMIAAAARRQVWVDMGFNKTYPNMYVVLIGPPGKCRKTTAINLAVGLLDGIDEISTSPSTSTWQYLIQCVKDAEVKTSILLDGQEKEYIHDSLTIISKELSTFLGQNDNELLAALTDLYDCHNKWDKGTKTAGVDDLINVWLNLLAASTPDWLVGSIGDTAIAGGFTSRVVFVVESDVRHKVARYRLTDEEREAEADLRHDIKEIAKCRGEYLLTDDADKFFIDWYEGDKHSPLTSDRRFAGYHERKHIHLIKVATILALADGSPNIIDEIHLRLGLDMLSEIEPKMVNAFGYSGRSELAADLGLIEETLKLAKTLSKVELTHLVCMDVDIRRLEDVIATLHLIGKVEIGSDDTKGIVYTYTG